MHGLRTERLISKRSLSIDLARHLYAQAYQGKIAIVCENPGRLYPIVKKQWMKLIRRVRRERASTLNAEKIAELTTKIAWMQGLVFSAKPPDDILGADVTFAVAESFVRIPLTCSIVYVTYEFEKEKLHMLTAWMPKNGKVVLYG